MLHKNSNPREFYAIYESFYRSRKFFILIEISQFEISEKPNRRGSVFFDLSQKTHIASDKALC